MKDKHTKNVIIWYGFKEEEMVSFFNWIIKLIKFQFKKNLDIYICKTKANNIHNIYKYEVFYAKQFSYLNSFCQDQQVFS